MSGLRKRLILVDDIQSNLDQGRSILKPYHEVFPARSAAKLFEILEKIEVDLILLDIDMPEMDGYEAIEILKADERWQEIPVVFLTAAGGESNIKAGMNWGATDYVVKPFAAEALLACIEKHAL